MGKNGEHSVRAIVIVLCLIASTVILDPISAEKNPPQLGSGGVYHTYGDWVVESSDDLQWANVVIIASGNLTIEAGGKLVLDNVEFRFNCTSDGQFGLTVLHGGTLVAHESIISSTDPSLHFRMVLRGGVLFESVSVSEVYGDPDAPWDHGIEVRSSSVQILNSSFFKCMGDVIHVESSSPRIIGNHFYENGGAAIYTNGTSSPLISKNQVYRQRFGIVSGFYSSPTIETNTIYDIDNNGLLLNGYMYPRVSNNVIYGCLNGMLLWYSNAILENNRLHNNEAGYNIKVDSRPTITGDTVRDNLYVGISINDSIVELVDCEVNSNSYDGIRVFNGSRAKVHSSEIRQNDDDGFQISDGYVEVADSTIDGNLGDQFFLRDSSVIDVMDSTIGGSWGGPSGSEVWHFNIGGGCTVTTFDSEFEGQAVSFGDDRSRLFVDYTCSFLVTNEEGDPVPDVSIDVLNETGYKRALGTGPDGRGERYLIHYDQRDLNGDGDGNDPGERTIHDYNFTIDEPGYIPFHGEIDIEGGDHIDVVLLERPFIKVMGTTPANGDLDIDVLTTIEVRFDKDIDPYSLDMSVSGPGGTPVFFEVSYDSIYHTIEATPRDMLSFGTTYTVEIKGVSGVKGEQLQSTYYLSFRTKDPPELDSDEDGIPDKEDPDDDNDGFFDVDELFYGTDPLDPLDYPVISDDDDAGDDDDTDPGTGPGTGGDDDTGDDDDGGIVIIPGTVTDDDDDPIDDGYDPIDTNGTMPDDPDDDMSFVILLIGSLFGFLILAGVILLMFIRGNRGHKLREVEIRPPPTGG
ncbi:MAG: right-handed parallel beta-helix repeat-containing protein [Thermoplasmatota archaeon]